MLAGEAPLRLAETRELRQACLLDPRMLHLSLPYFLPAAQPLQLLAFGMVFLLRPPRLPQHHASLNYAYYRWILNLAQPYQYFITKLIYGLIVAKFLVTMKKYTYIPPMNIRGGRSVLL